MPRLIVVGGSALMWHDSAESPAAAENPTITFTKTGGGAFEEGDLLLIPMLSDNSTGFRMSDASGFIDLSFISTFETKWYYGFGYTIVGQFAAWIGTTSITLTGNSAISGRDFWMLPWPVLRGLDPNESWGIAHNNANDVVSTTNDGTTHPLTVSLGAHAHGGYDYTLELIYSAVEGFHASVYSSHTIDGTYYATDARNSPADDVLNGAVHSAVNRWRLVAGGSEAHTASVSQSGVLDFEGTDMFIARQVITFVNADFLPDSIHRHYGDHAAHVGEIDRARQHFPMRERMPR